MRRGVWFGLVLGLMVLGAAAQSSAQGAPPVLEKIWVSPEVNHGSLLKVYLKASDPDGDMRWIIVSGGSGATASVPIRLKKDMRKEVNGYVWWDTSRAAKNSTGNVEIQIEDWKGNESQEMTVPVKIVPKGAKVQKAPAEFQEREIGPIMLGTFRTP